MIKIYTTPGCPYCEMTKQYLYKNNVVYQECNVVDDNLAREEMFSLSHQEGVPVIDIGGTVIVGFNRGEIDRALNLRK